MRTQLAACAVLLLASASFSQITDSLANYYYRQGVAALTKKDFDPAENLFKKSLDEQENAPAEYGLARVYRADTSHYWWNVSRQHIKEAIKLDPNNADYHLFYGLLAEDLFNMSKLEFDTIDDAIREYKETLRLDSTNVIAANHLGGIMNQRFLEYHNSVQIAGNPSTNWQTSLQTYIIRGRELSKQIYENTNMPQGLIGFGQFSNDALNLSEYCFKVLIKKDPKNPEPYLKLASVYEANNELEKGVECLQNLVRLVPDNKDAHLNLGLLYYRTSELDSAYLEYQKAISLMSKKEREDFTYNSVKVLLEPYLKDKLNEINPNSLKTIIDIFWKTRDPLDLTNYNERLLEHYSRVAYANLRFSVPKLGILGWETDRGTVVIRYGIPPKIFRIRPSVVVGMGTNTQAKTEIWQYPDKTFAFTDEFRNGKYIYAIPGQSQYWDDTQQYVKNLEASQPEEYNPTFEGPVFNILFTYSQFKDFANPDLTDLYIYYGIKPGDNDNTQENKNYSFKHTCGIFFFDNMFNKIAENKIHLNQISDKNRIDIPDSGFYYINAEELRSPPDTGNLSFEIMRDSDKGVSSHHGKFRIRNFNLTSLQMSDVVLASKVEKDTAVAGRLNRLVPSGKDYSILPNPTGIFSKDQDLYIYYEVYNLAKDEKGLTDFEQTIILKEKGEKGVSIGKLVGSVLKFIGVQGEDQQVGLTSKYHTNDKDSRIYLQLDMADYESGNYLLTVKIKDNITGKESEKDVNLFWR
jgi:GWxTD domain-containing protein